MKTISAPKITTLDNQEATIGQGISIPFSQVSAAGVNTTFIEAKLELKVTPHVSAGRLRPPEDQGDQQPAEPAAHRRQRPAVDLKREAETEVLVKDGETTVIGGIYTRQTANRTQRGAVPRQDPAPRLLLPERRASSDDHTELLIFITPRILNRQAIARRRGRRRSARP